MRGGRLACVVGTLIALSAVAPARAYAENNEGRRLVHPRTQIPTARNGGILNAGETAYLVYVDAQLFPMPVMFSIQHGFTYWMTLGIDVGGGLGTFQALLHARLENLPPIGNHRFFWGGHIRTGYKQQSWDSGPELTFDDVSWILTYENTFSVRLGDSRRHVLYLDTIFYADFDVTRSDRQVDMYLIPASLGYEVVLGANWNFYIEAGFIYSINGTQTRYGTLYEGEFFPVGAIGFAYRQRGERSALDGIGL